MKKLFIAACFIVIAALVGVVVFHPLASVPHVSPLTTNPAAQRQAALEQLQQRLPGVSIAFDERYGTPKDVHCVGTFLTGPNGAGRAVSDEAANRYAGEAHQAIKAFLDEYRALFGVDASALKHADVRRDYVNAHNGMRTVVLGQQIEGIPVYGAQLLANVTARGELVNIGSGFISDPGAAVRAGRSQPDAVLKDPRSSATSALAGAIRSLEKTTDAGFINSLGAPTGSTKVQTFKGSGFKGEARTQLTWMPVTSTVMRLAWDTVLTVRSTGEMQRIVVDAENFEPLSQMSLTAYFISAKQAAEISQMQATQQSGATLSSLSTVPPSQLVLPDLSSAGVSQTISLNVYTSDSPSPFTPGWPTSQTGQPPFVNRTLLTFDALNTTASPSGWIDANLETRGNNVDAHTDTNNDDVPDVPRPHGTGSSPVVFNFPIDFTQAPSTYSNASVTQLFYWCNFYHDKLYDFGFTEAAGNFQNDNFSRGGLGNDAVQADAQDGGGTNNANFSTPPDGTAGRMQMYLWPSAAPARDGCLDATIVLHEATHGLSNRLVGGGVGISALQPSGMGEGWSDFYALCLLSDPADDVNGTYPVGSYAIFGLAGYSDNYYKGIRRYPYCREPNSAVTAASKNPLTFKDIIINSEVHQQGEVWCNTLWECRSNLVNKYAGTATDPNRLMLQIVTDGMKLAPANPTFLQARDAIIQADTVDNAGANKLELWRGFAKRGMGFSAVAGSNNTTSGVVEAFDIPGDLNVTPNTDYTVGGKPGGPFPNSTKIYSLSNLNAVTSINWTATKTQTWLSVSPASGTLAPGGSIPVTVTLGASATSLAQGVYNDVITFTNTTNGSGSATRNATLSVVINPTTIADNFDPGIHSGVWSAITGAANADFTPVAPASSGNSLWFNDATTRVATTVPMDVTASNAVIKFSVILGSTVFPTEQCDAGEDVVLEYSTDGGTTFNIINTYITTATTAWTSVNIPVPAAAQTANTIFRWRQVAFSGASFDNWALDNVFVGIPDTTPPTVTVNQAAGQADPTGVGPINFTAVFSEQVSGFTSAGVTLSGSALPTTAVITGSGPTFNIAVSGMTVSGSVVVNLPANAAQDLGGNASLASTSTDNSVTYQLPGTKTWTGGSATSNNWSDDANWGGSHVVAGDNLVFAGSTRLSPVNDLPAGTNFTSIAFQSTGFNVTGNDATLIGTTALTCSTGTNALGLNLTLSGSTINVPTAGAILTLNGNLSVTSTTLQIISTGNTVINGVVSGASSQVLKTGTGTVILKRTNTYTGTTAISAGTLKLGVANALPATTAVTLSLGATLDFSDGTGSYAQTFAGVSGTGGTLTNSGATPATFTDTSTVTHSFSGVISGALNLSKTGISIFSLAGANTYTGTTTVSGGVLDVQNATALGASSAGTTVSGAELSVTGSFTITEPITVTSSGGTFVTNGITTFSSGWTLLGTASVTSSSVLTITGISGTGAFNNAGTGQVIVNGSATNYSGPLTSVAGNLTVNAVVPNSPVVVGSGASLSGTGTVGTVSLTGGTLQLGQTILSMGNLSATAGSTLAVTINGTTPGANYGQANVTGTVAINNVNLTITSGTLTAGTIFTIVKNDASDAISGTLAGLGEGGISNNMRVSYLGGDGNDLTLTQLISSAATTITASNSGWYDSNGTHTASNTNYACGYSSNVEHRDYFVFSLAGVSGTITGAELHIFNPASGYSSADPTETYASWDVSTPIATLVADAAGQTGIFTDLGSGVSYGSKDVSASDNNATVIVPLNSTAVAALNAQRGNQFAFGGSLTTIVGTASQTVFGFSTSANPRQLVLSFASAGGAQITSLAPNNSTINENDTVTVSGTISDPVNTNAHVLTLNWGDGSPVSVVNLAAGIATFSVAHQYLDDSPSGTSQDTYTIAATIFDGTSVGTASTSVLVKNVAPSSITANLSSGTINENDTVTLSGTFVDPGTLDTHTVTIVWGDGTANTVINLAAGVLAYSTTHKYLDDGLTTAPSDLYTISVSVADDDLGSGSTTTTVRVNNVAPVLSNLAATSINEGGTTTLTGRITDPGTLDTFSLLINWGDTSTTTLNLAAGTATFTQTHLYKDNNGASPYTIALTATDKDGGVGTGSVAAAVANITPVITAAASPSSILENGTTTVSGTITDPGVLDTFTVLIDWGDGGAATTLNLAAGSTSYSSVHRYLDNKATPYAVAVKCTDKDGAFGTASTQISVANVAPTVTIQGMPQVPFVAEGTVINLTSAVVDPGTLDTMTYAWTVTKNGYLFTSATTQNLSFTPDHSGTYVVMLTVTDKDHASGTAPSQTLVAYNVKPLVSILGAPEDATEGDHIHLTSAVEDPGTATTFTYNWLVTIDGNPYKVGASSSLNFDANLPGLYVVSLSVTDDDGGTGSTSSTFFASNVAPVVSISGAPQSSPEGTPISLTADVTDPGPLDIFSYAWSVTKDGQPFASSTQAQFTFMPDDNGSYVVSLVVTDQDDASDSATPITIAVTNVPPTVAIVGAPAFSPEGTPISLSSTVIDPGVLDTFAYIWSATKDGHAYADGTQPKFAFTPDDDGVYVVTLTVIDKDDGVGLATATINVVDVAPTIHIAGAPGTLQRGVAVPLFGIVTDPGILDTFEVVWNVTRDGVYFASGSGNAFTFTPNANGVYAVSVYVLDDDGAIGTDAVSWTMRQPPVIVSGLQALPNPVQVGKLVIFSTNVTAADALSYHWDFGDGTTADTTVSVADHAYAVPGNYTATLTATDGGGLSTLQTVEISVLAANQATAAGAEKDFDGDGFYDEIEAAWGTSPTDPNSTPCGNIAAKPVALALSGLKISLDFTTDGRDAIMVSGYLPIDVDTVLVGQRVLIDVGGVIKVFVLDEFGHANLGDSTKFRMVASVLKGQAVRPLAPFQAMLTGGGFKSEFVDEGLLSNTTASHVTRQVMVTILFNGQMLQTQQTFFYSAANGKGKGLAAKSGR